MRDGVQSQTQQIWSHPSGGDGLVLGLSVYLL